MPNWSNMSIVLRNTAIIKANYDSIAHAHKFSF